jgi:hypothetical protein
MKIKYKNEPITVMFSDLNPGDVFRTTCDETVYMKFEEIDVDGDYNCVSLEYGVPTFLAAHDGVVLLNATVVIQ